MPAPLIYLDHNATTPCDPRVVEAMLPYFYEKPGNASSRSHPFGWAADEAVQQAREQVAQLLQVETRELVFTSGATESLNLAIKGIFELYRRKGSHIITIKTEHKAVLDTCARLEKQGAEVTYLGVDAQGQLDLEALDAAIRPDTILVAAMWANNETGVIHPMAKIGAICDQHGVLLLSDATQAVGKICVDPKAAGVHLLACSAHKMYGPKGVGALYVCRRQPRVKVAPLLDGGGHEQGMRSGTLNVPGIVGFGQAALLASQEMGQDAQRFAHLRDKLENTLLQRLEAVQVNGNRGARLPHVSNLTFRHAESEAVMMSFRQRLALSTGSACSSAAIEPSHVLLAMGRSREDANCSLRFSLGRFNTEDEIEAASQAVATGVEKVRRDSPAWALFKEGVIS
jgi:cysteine desulfurase